jgi:hypothetical protein
LLVILSGFFRVIKSYFGRFGDPCSSRLVHSVRVRVGVRVRGRKTVGVSIRVRAKVRVGVRV